VHWRSLRLAALIALVGCSAQGEATPQTKPVDPDVVAAPAAPGTAAAAAAAAVPVRAEHDAFVLGANRHLAHRIVGGDLVVDAGSPGFSRYTRFGLPAPRWHRRVVAGEPTSAPTKGALLELPLTAEQATAARSLRLRVHARDAGGLTIKLSGEKIARVALVPGWQDIAVAASGWGAGENLLGFESSLGEGLRFRTISVSRIPADQPPAGAPVDPLARAGWNGAIGGFHVSDDAGLAWYLMIPQGAVLTAEVAGRCAVDVTARAGDGSLAAGRLTGNGRVDLGSLAGKVVRLELTGRECATGGLVLGARITLAGAGAAPPPDGPPPRYVIFWVMEALRADRIPTFQPGARAETPNFDKLAATGAVFRQHYVGGNESQVSHASMFTSLYPVVHTVRTAGNNQNFLIPKRFPTIGRIMKDAGFTTLGVTGNGFVGNSGGFNRGFVEYRNMMQEKGWRNGIIFGEKILAATLAKLEPRVAAGEPAFVFMGTIDNHSPLIARAPWIDRYSPDYEGPFQTGTVASVLGIEAGRMGCHKVPPRREIDRMRAIYDSAISYGDELIGDLLAELERLGIADETMIVISADHGEELFEEKRCGHGASLRDSLTRVPLLVHYPPRIAARIVDEGSEGVDILPTILDAAGIAAPAGLQGRSLRGLAAGEGAGWAQPSFASQYEYAHGMRLGRWKIRVKSGRPLIHDMVEDPDEHVDLAGKRPIERRYLTDHLGLYLGHRTRWKKASWGVASNMTEQGAREMERR
jgi:arylsulfatase A-like enzyme